MNRDDLIRVTVLLGVVAVVMGFWGYVALRFLSCACR